MGNGKTNNNKEISISNQEKLSSANSREDVRNLLKENFILVRKDKVHSRYAANKLRIQKEKGRRRGPGKVKGPKNARYPEKKRWMEKIRALRVELKNLRKENTITPNEYRKLYTQAKGNLFKNVSALKEAIEKKHEQERKMKEIEERTKKVCL